MQYTHRHIHSLFQNWVDPASATTVDIDIPCFVQTNQQSSAIYLITQHTPLHAISFMYFSAPHGQTPDRLYVSLLQS